MLREHSKYFFKDILYYGFGNMLYSLVQFFSMPLVVKTLSKDQVADWNILLPTGVLLAAIVTFGMDSATVRFLKDAEDDQQKSRIFSTGFFFEFLFALLLVFIMIIGESRATGLLNLSPGEKNSWLALVCWLPGIIMAQYFQNWFKYTFRRGLFVKLIAVQSLVYLGGIVTLKITGTLTLFNVMLVMLASQWVVAVIGLIICRRLFVLRIDKQLLRQLIAYGFPFMVMAFGFNFIMTMDRYILSGRLSKEEFAVYTQAVRISAIITMIVSSFNFAFGPFSLSLLGKPGAEKTFSRFHSYYLIVMCFAGLSFLAFGKLVITVFAGADYTEGYPFLLFFTAGYILYGLYSFAQLGIIYSKKSYLGIYILLAGIGCCALVGLLLAPYYKGYGTAAGFLVANVVMLLIANYYSAKYIHIRYSLVKDISLLCLFVLIGLAFTKLDLSDNFIIDGVVKFSSLLVLMPFIFIFILNQDEKIYLKRFLFRGRA
jgi:O-antigen/teichoic acid export membrane protein